MSIFNNVMNKKFDPSVDLFIKLKYSHTETVEDFIELLPDVVVEESLKRLGTGYCPLLETSKSSLIDCIYRNILDKDSVSGMSIVCEVLREYHTLA